MFHILFEKANSFYENLFRRYGRFLANFYIYVIIASFVLNCLLSLGISKFNLLTNSDDLFVPIDSQAKQDEKLIKSLFSDSRLKSEEFFLHQLADLGKWGEINFLTCPNQNDEPDNILQEKYLSQIKTINDIIINSTIVHAGNQSIGFDRICAKQNGKCLIDGLGLLSKSFYVTKLNEFMLKKELKLNEIKSMDDNSQQNQVKNKINQFRFYIAGTSMTDLTYNLGIYSK